MSSRGFRKHVSTISQLFNLNRNELENLADFLGHSLDVHNEFYKMPLEMVQKTQISKIFYTLEEGKAKHFAGKSLKDLDNEDPPSKVVQKRACEKTDSESDDSEHKPKRQRGTFKRNPFTVEQKNKILNHFSFNIVQKKVPKQTEIEKFKQKFPEFTGVPWEKIKLLVYNQWSAKRRNVQP